jgi:hypothetical protein
LSPIGEETLSSGGKLTPLSQRGRAVLPEVVATCELAVEVGFKAEQVIGDWVNFYNTERPHSVHDGQTPAEAYGNGRPMDMMVKAIALTTSPQAQQQQQQDVINRFLAA